MNHTIFALIIFVGILGILSTAFFGTAYNIAVSNVNSTVFLQNSTVVNSTLTSAGTRLIPPVCEPGNTAGILVIFDAPSMIGCAFSYIGWFFSFVFMTSDIPYLGVIFAGTGAVILAWIVQRIRGG